MGVQFEARCRVNLIDGIRSVSSRMNRYHSKFRLKVYSSSNYSKLDRVMNFYTRIVEFVIASKK